MLTEQKNNIGDYLIEKGAECGVVTGRRRRCGWLDLISLKYSVRVNSLTELFITKLDVLSGLEKINLCIGYKYENELLTDYPYKESVHYKAEPVYKTLEGWTEDNTSTKIFEDLPKSITCAGRPIREYDNEIPANLTAEEILIRSGNIGSVRIVQMLGIEKFKNFLEKIGVLKKIEFKSRN